MSGISESTEESVLTGCSAIIIQNQKVLLVRRRHDLQSFPSAWCCPGGTREPGESARQTVTRELKEETDLDFIPAGLYVTYSYQERNLGRFLGTFSGRVKLQKEELTQWGWFDAQSCKNLEMAFDYRDVVQRLKTEGLIL